MGQNRLERGECPSLLLPREIRAQAPLEVALMTAIDPVDFTRRTGGRLRRKNNSPCQTDYKDGIHIRWSPDGLSGRPWVEDEKKKCGGAINRSAAVLGENFGIVVHPGSERGDAGVISGILFRNGGMSEFRVSREEVVPAMIEARNLARESVWK